MSPKGTLTTGATGSSPPKSLRATRSQTNTKNAAQQVNTSPQATTLEKKRAKARELEIDAHKLLKSEECLEDEFNITHHTIQSSLTSIIKRYSATTSPNLAKSLAALVVLLKQANNASGPATQLEPTVDALSHKIGERIEKTLQEEMIKLSSQIKVSLAEQSTAMDLPWLT